MAVAPYTSRPLYRKAGRAVICGALAMSLSPLGWTQAPQKAKVDKGPRAVGLVQLAPNGKAYLIPVVIMLNGEFYDASAYKAAPVPMALESGIVYEAEKSGVSQGLFTVKDALEGPNNTWKAEGTWLPEGAKAANAPHKAETKPRDIDPQDGPPVLRRREPEAAKPEPPPAESPTPAASAPPAAKPADSTPPVASAAPAPPPTPVEKDPNIPILKRGKPAPLPPEPKTPAVSTSAAASPKTNAAESKTSPAKPSAAPLQTIAAISDAGGPEPRPYIFSSMKPEDEQKLRKQVLEMAAAEVQARARQLSAAIMGASATPAKKSAAKSPPPQFDDVQLHIFDLSTNNEPVAVLTATARLPQKGAPDTEYLLTLVARQNIYGDLHKAFSNITDAQHLDVLPRMDLIDAVDVDGDGRGELLFRKSTDTGSAFVVYRVIGEQLWPLFDGAPGS